MEFPHGFSDTLKQQKVNAALHDTECDWIIMVDADEFIWPHGDLLCANVAPFLHVVDSEVNVVFANMWDVFRHEGDTDLNPSDPVPVLQRTHGSTLRGSHYRKPIVIRSGRGIRLSPGNHEPLGDVVWREGFDGAHWQNADPCFAVARRVRDRSQRLSPTNLSRGMGAQHFNLTEEQVLELCRSHLQDPKLFGV